MKRPAPDAPEGIDERASRTAMWTNICRAMAYKETHPLLKGPDHVAAVFLSPYRSFLLNFKAIRTYIQRKLTPGAYEYLMARTRHFDNLFRDALREGVPQIVFLGAGYDTRSIRFKDRILETKIFELDAASTQAHKRALLRKANVSLPRQLSFASIDFRHEKIETVLADAGYDDTRTCLFIWEGVTMYLPEKSIRQTLAFIRNHSGPMSTVAFDYFFRSVVEGASDVYGAREQYEAVRKLGEPFQFGLPAGGIAQFLTESGFRMMSHHTPDQFERTYLTDENGRCFARMYRCGCNVHAMIDPGGAC